MYPYSQRLMKKFYLHSTGVMWRKVTLILSDSCEGNSLVFSRIGGRKFPLILSDYFVRDLLVLSPTYAEISPAFSWAYVKEIRSYLL